MFFPWQLRHHLLNVLLYSKRTNIPEKALATKSFFFCLSQCNLLEKGYTYANKGLVFGFIQILDIPLKRQQPLTVVFELTKISTANNLYFCVCRNDMAKLDIAKEINEYRPKNCTFQREKQAKRPVRTKRNHEKPDCVNNLPRSTSMQIFGTKPPQDDDPKKFNSLINQKAKNQIARKTENLTVLINNCDVRLQSKLTKSNRKSKMFEVGSSSSMDSAENGNLLNTGCLFRNSAANDSIRKVRSSPCIADEVPELGNCSGAESLPNLNPKLKAKRSGYCPSDSGSSTTTEQSGWISSR